MKNIKSKERVKKNAEVFTAKREVRDMLNLLPNLEPISKVLEPSCGNGNFLIEIFKYKFRKSEKRNIDVLISLAFTYGVDIMEDNIVESRERLIRYIKKLGFSEEVISLSRKILINNLIVGNFLEDRIKFCDYRFTHGLNFIESWSYAE